MTSVELIDCGNLDRGAVLDIETKNRHYVIECLGGSAIRISGHPDLCPTPVEGRLRGSSDKNGVVEPLIGRGRYLQFLLDDRRPVTTSRVLHVRVHRPVGPPARSSSIH